MVAGTKIKIHLPILQFSTWLAAAVAVVVGLTLAFAAILADANWPAGTDLSLYLSAAKAIMNGHSPYDPAYFPGDPYGYPPLFAEFIAVLGLALGEWKRWIVWSAAGLACLPLALALLGRGFGRKTPYKFIALIFGLMTLGAITRSDIFHVQPHFILLLLIAGGLYAFRQGRAVLGALLLGLVIVCKPFTGIFVFVFLRRGQIREALLTLFASGGLFAASFLPLLPRLQESFHGWVAASRFHTSSPNIAKGANETYVGLFNRLFTETPYSTPWIVAPHVVPWLSAAVLLVGVLGIYFGVPSKAQRAAEAPDERGAHDLLEFSLALGLIMACGPLMESPHVFMILPGVFGAAMLAQSRWRAGAANKSVWVAAAAAWGLILALFVYPRNDAIVNLYTLGHLEGLAILISVKTGVLVSVACWLSAAALVSDRGAATLDG